MTVDYNSIKQRMFRVAALFTLLCVIISDAYTTSLPTRSATSCWRARDYRVDRAVENNKRMAAILLPLHSTPTTTSSSSAEVVDAGVYQVSIEYCTGCRWGLRAFWMAQELLTTFADDLALQAVTLVPSKEAGRFLVQCYSDDGTDIQQLWDRTINGGFPEMKELKRLVRDQIDPSRYLGHSDTENRKDQADTATTKMERMNKSGATFNEDSGAHMGLPTAQGAVAPHVSILYCTGCRWMLRAAYLAQELLSTFEDEINSITLVPSRPPALGGTFAVMLDTKLIWDRREIGSFPETKELKQLVRDQLNPTKDLGHSDKRTSSEVETVISEEDGLDDDEAERTRAFFGVA